MLPAIAILTLATVCAQAQDEPVFRSGTRLVQIDVVVRDKKGTAYGLTQDQFKLLDNSKPQAIATFVAPTPPPAPIALPPGAVSNRLTSSGESLAGVTVVLLDWLNTPVGLQPVVNRQVQKFVDARAGKDRVAILTLGHQLQVVSNFSADKNRLAEAVRGLKPQNVMPVPSSLQLVEPIIRMRMNGITRAMQDVARYLAKIPGRKNLIWISASFPIAMHTNWADFDFSPDIAKIMRILSDGNISVYPIDARGLVTGSVTAEIGGCRLCVRPPTEPPDLNTLNFIAGQTDGRAFYNSNGIAESMRDAIEYGDRPYLLGFYPSEADLDGTFHKVRVNVTKSGYSTRARRGYLAIKLDGEQPPVHPQLTDLQNAALDATDIGLVAQVEWESGNRFHLILKADAHDLALLPEEGRRVGMYDLSISYGSSGGVMPINVDLSEADFTKALAEPFGVSWQIPITYDTIAPKELRVVLQEHSSGAAGSIRVPVLAH